MDVVEMDFSYIPLAKLLSKKKKKTIINFLMNENITLLSVALKVPKSFNDL